MTIEVFFRSTKDWKSELLLLIWTKKTCDLKTFARNWQNLSSKYDNIMLIGDFHSESAETTIYDFCEICNIANLVNEKTYFKNPSKPTWIDLIVINMPKCFQSTMVIETGYQTFTRRVLQLWKSTIISNSSFTFHYRKFKNFCIDDFIKNL